MWHKVLNTVKHVNSSREKDIYWRTMFLNAQLITQLLRFISAPIQYRFIAFRWHFRCILSWSIKTIGFFIDIKEEDFFSHAKLLLHEANKNNTYISSQISLIFLIQIKAKRENLDTSIAQYHIWCFRFQSLLTYPLRTLYSQRRTLFSTCTCLEDSHDRSNCVTDCSLWCLDVVKSCTKSLRDSHFRHRSHTSQVTDCSQMTASEINNYRCTLYFLTSSFIETQSS